MSGRARTIKPELLDDPTLSTLSHEAFRLFVGVLLEADDAGNFRASPRYLGGVVFHSVDLDTPVDAILEELVNSDVVTLYQVRGQRYGSIRDWAVLQRIDRPSMGRVPPPPGAVDDADTRTPQSYIYFIRGVVGGPIKIGCSFDVARRLCALQVSSPEPLVVLAAFPGDRGRETALHKKFGAIRVHGEWFRPEEPLLGYIRTAQAQGGLPTDEAT